MIDVVYLIGHLPRAGAARHLFQLVRGLDRQSFRPQIVCLQKIGGLVGSFEAEGVPVHGIGVPSVRNPLFLPRLVKLVGLLRRLKPVVLQTYLFPSNFFGSIAARLAGVPVLITTRRAMSEIEPPRHARGYRLVNRAADRIVAVSEAAADSAARSEGQPRERYLVVENGMDPSPYDGGHDRDLKQRLFGVPAEKRLVGMLSSLRAKKGHMEFIEMAERLTRSGCESHYVLAGDGPDRDEVARRVANAGLSGRFVLAGLRDDVPEVLRSLDVFVYPSHSEGISNALMEAMAAGCPIVAARCEGNEILLGDGAGVIVPPGDADALAGETRRILEDAQAASRLRTTSRARISEKFSADRMAAGFTRIYRACLEEKGLSPVGRMAQEGGDA